VCFTCGEPGHLARSCPQAAAVAGAPYGMVPDPNAQHYPQPGAPVHMGGGHQGGYGGARTCFNVSLSDDGAGSRGTTR